MSTTFNLTNSLKRLHSVQDEGDIRGTLLHVLQALTDEEWKVEVSVDEGRVDLICPTLRVLIETKSKGKVGPDKSGSKFDESQKEQVARYLRSVSPSLFDDIHSDRPWRGFLTDGAQIWGWRWDHRLDELVPLFSSALIPSELYQTREFFNTHFDLTSPRAAPTPPTDLASRLLLPIVPQVHEILLSLEGQRNLVTKFNLWQNLLKGSGIIPPGELMGNQVNVFEQHSVLVLASRLLVGILSQPKLSELDQISNAADGFHGWILETDVGQELTRTLLRRLRGYDWYGSTQDVLKHAYESIIEKNQRKEFGEFYTPDNLAQDVVAQVLDEDWLIDSIERATKILQGDTDPSLSASLGVLDPACGSGTFLFHAARRIYARIREKYRNSINLAPQIVAMLVHGIDVHPVAIEMAQATLAMAIPGPTPPLRVMVGDSLQLESGADILGPSGIILLTPGGRSIEISNDLIKRPDFSSMLGHVVQEACHHQKSSQLSISKLEMEEDYTALYEQLRDIIEHEGDHVWHWHLHNRIELERLRVQKVSRLIGNPPWLVQNDTPDGARKRNINALRKKENVAPSRRSSAKGDLATVFSARVTRLYLGSNHEKTSSFRYGWVLPGSAIKSLAWDNWRTGEWAEDFTVDHEIAWCLDRIKPPLFPHSPYGCCVIMGRVSEIAGRTIGKVEDWHGSMESFSCVVRKQHHGAESSYLPKVFNGALSKPQPLLLITETTAFKDDLVRVTLKYGNKGAWKDISKRAILERQTLLPIVRAQVLNPFKILPDEYALLAPIVNNELLDPLSSTCEKLYPLLHDFWKEIDEEYRKRRTSGARPTLFENLNFNNTLSKQLHVADQNLLTTNVKVVYNASGNTLRSAVIDYRRVVDQKMYWIIAESEEEALYLCGILNSPGLQNAWREGKSAHLHYDKSPWRYVPIPLFDQTKSTHAQIAEVAKKVSTKEEPCKHLHMLDDPVSTLLPEFVSE